MVPLCIIYIGPALWIPPRVERIPDEATCVRWLLETNPALIGLRLKKVSGRDGTFLTLPGKRTVSAREGTVFAGSKLKLRQWYYLILDVILRERAPRSTEIARYLRIQQRTAWTMLDRLRRAAVVAGPGDSAGSCLPLGLLVGLARLAKKEVTAASWKEAISRRPPPLKHREIGKMKGQRDFDRIIGDGRDKVESLLAGRDTGRPWRNRLEIWQAVLEQIRRHQQPHILKSRPDRAMGRAGELPAELPGPVLEVLLRKLDFLDDKEVRGILSETRKAATRLRRERPGTKVVHVVARRVMRAEVDPRDKGFRWVLTARTSGGPEYFWSATTAPTTRRVTELYWQLRGRYGWQVNFVTNYGAFARIAATGNRVEIAGKSPVH